MKRLIFLLTAAVLIGGCASTPYQQWRAQYEEFGCSDYGIVHLPSYAKYFDVEPMPEECLETPPPVPALAGMERVTIHDAETGSTRSVIVPRGTVIVK